MNRLGMTKIEVLVIALIVGLLGVMAVLAISSARTGARDAVRLSDVRQTQTGLELYFNDANAYPERLDSTPLGVPATACLSERGFSSSCVSTNESVYLDVVGAPPAAGLSGAVSCAGVNNAYCYVGQDGSYRIEFELENRNPLLELRKGVNCATETGMVAGACEALPGTEQTQ